MSESPKQQPLVKAQSACPPMTGKCPQYKRGTAPTKATCNQGCGACNNTAVLLCCNMKICKPVSCPIEQDFTATCCSIFGIPYLNLHYTITSSCSCLDGRTGILTYSDNGVFGGSYADSTSIQMPCTCTNGGFGGPFIVTPQILLNFLCGSNQNSGDFLRVFIQITSGNFFGFPLTCHLFAQIPNGFLTTPFGVGFTPSGQPCDGFSHTFDGVLDIASSNEICLCPCKVGDTVSILIES